MASLQPSVHGEKDIFFSYCSLAVHHVFFSLAYHAQICQVECSQLVEVYYDCMLSSHLYVAALSVRMSLVDLSKLRGIAETGITGLVLAYIAKLLERGFCVKQIPSSPH